MLWHQERGIDVRAIDVRVTKVRAIDVRVAKVRGIELQSMESKLVV